MGNGKTLSARGWAWLAGLTLVATFLAVTPVASQAVEVGSGDSILVVAAHPDDDIILTAGIIERQLANGGDVTVAIMTNGDRCASVSQGPDGNGYCSAVDPRRLGRHARKKRSKPRRRSADLRSRRRNDDSVIFLGYPNGFLDFVRYGDDGAFPELFHTETYATYGLDDTDWHNSRMGSGHVAYPSGSMAEASSTTWLH